MTDSPTHGPADAAPLLSRVAARVIDGVLIAIVLYGLGSIFGFGYGWLVLGAVATLAYFALFDALAGTTPGKRLLKLRIESPGGGRPAFPQAVAREAFTAVGAMPYVGPVLAIAAWIFILVTIRSSPSGQGVHDRWAGGTRVRRAS